LGVASSGGGTSTICGTGFLSHEDVARGGDLLPTGTLRNSGILDVLVLLMGSSSLRIDSKFEGGDDRSPDEGGDGSRPAGLEKFVGPVLPEPDGSFSVSARLERSMVAKLGIVGMGGMADSGVSGRLPLGLAVAALLAALCA